MLASSTLGWRLPDGKGWFVVAIGDWQMGSQVSSVQEEKRVCMQCPVGRLELQMRHNVSVIPLDLYDLLVGALKV